MLKSQLHSFLYSKLVIASAFIFLTATSAYFYVESNNYKTKLDNQNLQISNLNEKIDVLERDVNTFGIENSLLIADYQFIDSLFYDSKVQSNSNLDENLIVNQRNKLEKANKENNELKSKIAKLLVEVQGLQKEVSKNNQTENFVNQNIDIHNSEKIVSNQINFNKIKYKSFATFKSSRGIKNTKKARKANVINLCIDFSELNNESVFDNQEIYFRIANPNGKILSSKNEDSDVFAFDGHNIVYSLKAKSNFNEAKTMFCVNYTPNTALIPGVYWIDIFIENQKIGETSFELY